MFYFLLESHLRKLPSNRPVRLIFHLDCKPKLANLKKSFKNFSYLSSVCCLNVMIQQIVLANGKTGFHIMFPKLLSWVQKKYEFILQRIENVKSIILEKENNCFQRLVICQNVSRRQGFLLFLHYFISSIWDMIRSPGYLMNKGTPNCHTAGQVTNLYWNLNFLILLMFLLLDMYHGERELNSFFRLEFS